MNLQVTTHTATALTFTWMASEDIDQFEITYNYTIKRCSEQGSTMREIVSGSSRSHTLRNLSEDSSYIITVRPTMDTITADTSASGEKYPFV